MIVKIPITPNHDGCPLYVKELEISDFCPICGVKRGEIQHGVHSYDGSRWVGCDGWKNPCGHIDKYENCVKEAIALKRR